MIKTMITIGPRSCNAADIKLFAQQSTLFRLNGSHSDLKWHEDAIKLIRSTCPQAFIMLDVPGIKPRTANKKIVHIEKGEKVIFGKFTQFSSQKLIELTKPLPEYSKNLKTFSVNDGQFLFDVCDGDDDFIVGSSRESFELLTKKGLNIPESIYDEQEQYRIYHDFIEKVSHLDVSALGLSFVQTGELISEIRRLTDLLLISKVENSEGLRNVGSIAAVSDAIMIDRGDLVAEIGFENLFSGVEEIAQVTKSYGRPLIMATENLESMTERDVPSKSEVISLAHSAKIGVDCFMLSEETAVSENKHVIVQWLADFLSNEIPYQPVLGQIKIGKYKLIWEALAGFSDLPAIIASKSGYAMFDFLSFKPKSELTIVTNSKKIGQIIKLYRQNINVIMKDFENIPSSQILNSVVSENHKELFKFSDQLLGIYVSNYLKIARANTLSIFDKTDYE